MGSRPSNGAGPRLTDRSNHPGNKAAVLGTASERQSGVTGLPRSVASALRTSLVRAFHPLRRWQAIRRLRRGPSPSSILVLCDGNICRSPFAEALLMLELGTDSGAEVTSAGFIGPGRETPPEGVETAHRMGVDLTGHVSRSVNRSMLRDADLIVVMDKRQGRAVRGLVDEKSIIMLGDLDPLPPRRRAIADPWGRGPAAFEASYARIQRCILTLAESVRHAASLQRSGPARGSTPSEGSVARARGVSG